MKTLSELVLESLHKINEGESPPAFIDFGDDIESSDGLTPDYKASLQKLYSWLPKLKEYSDKVKESVRSGVPPVFKKFLVELYDFIEESIRENAEYLVNDYNGKGSADEYDKESQYITIQEIVGKLLNVKLDLEEMLDDFPDSSNIMEFKEIIEELLSLCRSCIESYSLANGLNNYELLNASSREEAKELVGNWEWEDRFRYFEKEEIE